MYSDYDYYDEEYEDDYEEYDDDYEYEDDYDEKEYVYEYEVSALKKGFISKRTPHKRRLLGWMESKWIQQIFNACKILLVGVYTLSRR